MPDNTVNGADTGAMQLILIDDHELVLMSVSLALMQARPELVVHPYARCEPALLHRPEAISHVLVDFQLSPADPSQAWPLQGWHCLRALTKRFPASRRVMMSAYPRAQMLAAALDAGAHDYVEKSLQSSAMMRSLFAALQL